jgi:AcrR family transcriptional regulator
MARKASKERRSRDQARQEILDQATNFLWDHAYRDMTVARLMDRTTIGRSAFYAYFRDTAHLAEVLLQDVFTSIQTAVRLWLDGEGEDPPKAMFESIQGLVEVCVEKGPIVRAVSEATAASAHLERIWNDFMSRFDTAIENRLRAEQKAGRVGSLNARETARALNQLDAAYLIHSFGRRPQTDPQEVTQALASIWISTVYGRESMDLIELPQHDDTGQETTQKGKRKMYHTKGEPISNDSPLVRQRHCSLQD